MNKYSVDYPLTNYDISKILNNNCKIIEYSDLYDIESLKDIMIDKCIVILYRSSDDSAHWCCIFEHDNNDIEFFDPYGTIIDNEIEQIKHVNPSYAQQYYHGKRLIELILKGNYKDIIYNNYKMQELKSNINTCGRHVCCRLLFKDYSLDDYVNMLKMKSGKYLDKKVLQITNKLI